MVIDSKAGDGGSAAAHIPRKTFSDNLASTFSSPLAWILVLALIITWSCVFIIMFDVVDHKAITGHPQAGIRKVFKDSGRRGGLSKISSDPVKAMNDAVEESTNVISSVFRFAANLIAPEDEEVEEGEVEEGEEEGGEEVEEGEEGEADEGEEEEEEEEEYEEEYDEGYDEEEYEEEYEEEEFDEEDEEEEFDEEDEEEEFDEEDEEVGADGEEEIEEG
uniref:Triadin n=1 Tax=Nothobranchius furzeri TaxID=105023 RepID=A0A8C6L5X4_NOTFU